MRVSQNINNLERANDIIIFSYLLVRIGEMDARGAFAKVVADLAIVGVVIADALFSTSVEKLIEVVAKVFQLSIIINQLKI